MANLVNDTLSAWLLVESLQPGEVKYDKGSTLSKGNFQNNEQQKQLQSFEDYYDIWNDERYKIAEQPQKYGKRIFRLYRNCFYFKEIDKEIQNIFNDNAEIFNPNEKRCYGYTFQTDENGKVVTDSLHIPMIMSALKEIRKNKSANIEQIFNDTKRKFQQKFNEIIADEPINEDKIKQLDEAYRDFFAVLISETNGIFKHYFTIEYVKNSESPDPDFNSFFIGDIERARKDPNQTLKAYIEGIDDTKRIEVDENKEVFEEFLHPENLPDGRWPSQIEHKLSLMQQLAVLDSAPVRVTNAWNVMHLIFPVVSTTFASFASMYRGLSKDFIDYLFIDEAGQALPQAAVGALYRSKRVIAVGDPIQIEPVVTMEDNLIANIRKGYHIHERLLSKASSVQTVADFANKYGYWKTQTDDEDSKYWIGIPLWVHRRCLKPMFTIANQIAYDNKMVLPKTITNIGKTGWYDIKGNSVQRQFVKEQGDKVIALLKNDWKQAIENGEHEPSVYVISPFTEVKKQIQLLARKELLHTVSDDSKKVSDWIKIQLELSIHFRVKKQRKFIL